MLRLSVGDAPKELRATARAVAAASRDIRNDLNRRVRAEFKPVWVQALNDRVQTPRDQLLTAGARIIAGNPPVLVTASTKKKVGRLVANEHWAGFEYGAAREEFSQYRRKGQAVRRRVKRGHPQRRRKGRVIEPTVVAILPRIASLWTQTTIKTFLDALEKGGGSNG